MFKFTLVDIQSCCLFTVLQQTVFATRWRAFSDGQGDFISFVTLLNSDCIMLFKINLVTLCSVICLV